MQFKTLQQRRQIWESKQRDFRRWFAWYPVRLNYRDEDGIIWFGWVERRRQLHIRASIDDDPRYQHKTYQYRKGAEL